MGVEIRPIEADEFVEFATVLEVAAGRQLSAEVLDDLRAGYDVERTLAAFEAERIVAGTGSDAVELTVHGPRVVRAARITHTGVLPTHRRRGLVTGLWTRQLAELRRRGEALAIFTTSGPGIYRSLGYGPATWALELEVPTRRGGLREAGSASDGIGLRMADAAEASELLPEIFERHRRAQPGQVSRSRAFWEVWLQDRARYRRPGSSERFVAISEDDGGAAQGYLSYRLVYGDLKTEPVSGLDVEDLIAVTAQGRRALWSFCLSFEQAAVVTASNLPVDEPLVWALAGPRGASTVRLRQFLWARLIDVPAALSARRYAVSGTLVLEVRDAAVDENAGCFRLVASNAEAECVRTADPPDLALDVSDLAAVYLGGTTFTTLARAGRAAELSTGAAERGDLLFVCRPAAWTVTDW